jgi:hypothetical protein
VRQRRGPQTGLRSTDGKIKKQEKTGKRTLDEVWGNVFYWDFKGNSCDKRQTNTGEEAITNGIREIDDGEKRKRRTKTIYLNGKVCFPYIPNIQKKFAL